jgi:hypothetical protein
MPVTPTTQNTHKHINPSPADTALTLRAIQLNNEGGVLFKRGDNEGARRLLEEALAIKVPLYGEKSVHVCISLSGLADAHLELGKAAPDAASAAASFAAAEREAQRHRGIAVSLGLRDQERIAHEILVDIAAARKARGLGPGSPPTPPPVVEVGKRPAPYIGVSPSGTRITVSRKHSSCDGPRCSGADADMRCSNCRRVTYCSKACQRDAWPSHKAACRSNVAADAAAADAAAADAAAADGGGGGCGGGGCGGGGCGGEGGEVIAPPVHGPASVAGAPFHRAPNSFSVVYLDDGPKNQTSCFVQTRRGG